MAKKIIKQIVICALILVAINMALAIFTPTFNNEMAMLQFEQDNAAYMAFSAWQYVPIVAAFIEAIIISLYAIKIIKIVKNEKGDNNK